MSRVIVYHSSYGCDTGCCGHIIKVSDSSKESFTFSHPYWGNDYLQFAKDLVASNLGEEHVADLDWDNCLIVSD